MHNEKIIWMNNKKQQKLDPKPAENNGIFSLMATGLGQDPKLED